MVIVLEFIVSVEIIGEGVEDEVETELDDEEEQVEIDAYSDEGLGTNW